MPATACVTRASPASSLGCWTWRLARGRRTWRWGHPLLSPSPTFTRQTPPSPRQWGASIQSKYNSDPVSTYVILSCALIFATQNSILDWTLFIRSNFVQKRGAWVLCWHFPWVWLSSCHPSKVPAQCHHSEGPRCSNTKVYSHHNSDKRYILLWVYTATDQKLKYWQIANMILSPMILLAPQM